MMFCRTGSEPPAGSRAPQILAALLMERSNGPSLMPAHWPLWNERNIRMEFATAEATCMIDFERARSSN
jgi:hypothetical protein